ncbi:hypothetical protein [Virgibacillus sp. DJP39]|uniref:hypothetical protein n=1 Tax=Virgibacillus sp. DJP39 TaxID=3409790 RepID=UPI003BB6FB34
MPRNQPLFWEYQPSLPKNQPSPKNINRYSKIPTVASERHSLSMVNASATS